MKHYGIVFSFLFLLVINNPSLAQVAPDIVWQETLGGYDHEDYIDIEEMPDQNLILGISSRSGIGGNKLEPNDGGYDYWIIKSDKLGNKLWEKNYGSSSNDELRCVHHTSAGGFIVGGGSQGGKTRDRDMTLKGISDGWVLKLLPNGSIDWQESYGGNGTEAVVDIIERGSGYLVLLSSNSAPSLGKTASSYGGYDFWLQEISASGVPGLQWSFGGSGDDTPTAIIETSDGGYIITGTTNSPISGTKTSSTYGLTDIWVVKLSSSLVQQWDKTFGGSSRDSDAKVVELPNGVLVRGNSESPIYTGNKNTPLYGTLDDVWLNMLDLSTGNRSWEKTIGGNHDDDFGSMVKTKDGNVIITSSAISGATMDKTTIAKGPTHIWLFKINPYGDILWQKSVGGSDLDVSHDIIQTYDGGLLLGNISWSNASIDKTDNSAGLMDAWLVKLYNSSYWDKSYDSTGVYSNQDIKTDNLTEGSNNFWSITETNSGSLWLQGLNKTSGNSVKSIRYTSPNYKHSSVLHDFSGDLLIASNLNTTGNGGFLKFRVNKTNGTAISPTFTEVYMENGGYYEETDFYPLDMLEAAGNNILVGMLDNQNIKAQIGLVNVDPSLFNVNAISHYVDPQMANYEFMANRAIEVPGNELLIVGAAMAPNDIKIFAFKIDASTGSPTTDIYYYSSSYDMDRIDAEGITVTEVNKMYKISYTLNTNGQFWPAVLSLDNNLSPLNSHYYESIGGINADGGFAGQIMNDGQDIAYSVSFSHGGIESAALLQIDGNSGAAMPNNQLFENGNAPWRSVSAGLKTNNKDFLLSANHANIGKSHILASLNPQNPTNCSESISIQENRISMVFNSNPINDITDSWYEQSYAISNTKETGTERSCLCVNDSISYKRSISQNDNFPNTVNVSTESLDVSILKTDLDGVFKIESSSQIEAIKVYSISGKKILEFNGSSHSELLDLSQYARGIYIIAGKSTEGETFSSKLIR